ncbi:hypothetical protein D3C73_1328270 [compost metagenome]
MLDEPHVAFLGLVQGGLQLDRLQLVQNEGDWLVIPFGDIHHVNRAEHDHRHTDHDPGVGNQLEPLKELAGFDAAADRPACIVNRLLRQEDNLAPVLFTLHGLL